MSADKQPNLFALVHSTLLNQPEAFVLWFNGSACVGPAFTIVIELWRDKPTIIFKGEPDLIGADLQSAGNVELEIPFWWRRRIVKAARRVVIRAAMQRVLKAPIDLCTDGCRHHRLKHTKGYKPSWCAHEWPGAFSAEGYCTACPKFEPQENQGSEGAQKIFLKKFSKGGDGSTS